MQEGHVLIGRRTHRRARFAKLSRCCALKCLSRFLRFGFRSSRNQRRAVSDIEHIASDERNTDNPDRPVIGGDRNGQVDLGVVSGVDVPGPRIRNRLVFLGEIVERFSLHLGEERCCAGLQIDASRVGRQIALERAHVPNNTFDSSLFAASGGELIIDDVPSPGGTPPAGGPTPGRAAVIGPGPKLWPFNRIS